MRSLFSKNQYAKYLLCAIVVFIKYAWVKLLKDKKGKAVLNAFVEIVNESSRKPNKLWVDQEREFYNKLMQDRLDDNNILMYSTHNEGKSVIVEWFIKILTAKVYKKMTANNSKSYLAYLRKLLHKYNNTYHHSINKKPINADYSALTEKSSTNFKALKFKINDRVRNTRYKNIFSKSYTENWSREISVINWLFKTNP